MATGDRSGKVAALSSVFTRTRRIAGQGREHEQENTLDPFTITADERRTPRRRRKSRRADMHELVPAWRVGNGLVERAITK